MLKSCIFAEIGDLFVDQKEVSRILPEGNIRCQDSACFDWYSTKCFIDPVSTLVFVILARVVDKLSVSGFLKVATLAMCDSLYRRLMNQITKLKKTLIRILVVNGK